MVLEYHRRRGSVKEANMVAEKLSELLQKKKNFVLIGEAGSGKTEIALSLAAHMTRLTDRQVHVFDMDQTKPDFRARDAKDQMEAEGVHVHFHEQLLDTPTVATGVKEHLKNPGACVLMDVGGGNYGAHMIGQFHELLNAENALVLYVVNPYRPWSGDAEAVEETMRRVLGSARLERISVLANPNFGPHTTLEEIVSGVEKVRALVGARPVDFVCALEKHCAALEELVSEPVIPIRLHTLPDWMLQ